MYSISLGFVLAINSVFLTQSYQVKPDNKIEASAAARAAARIGALRGTISYDRTPVILTPSSLKHRKGFKNTQGNQSIYPAKNDSEIKQQIQPIVQNSDIVIVIDPVTTGSIKRERSVPRPRPVLWQLFNKYGRPVER